MRSAILQRRRRAGTILLGAVAILLAAWAPRAGAVTVYGPYDAFDDGASPLGSVAVDQSNGDIYVVDDGRQYVAGFRSNEDEYPPLTGAATPAGSFAFSEPTSVMVDNSGGPNDGDIFVTDTGHNVVDIFAPDRTYLGQLTGANTPAGAFKHPSGLAMDSNGDLYVSDLKHKAIDKFDIGATPVTDADYSSQLTSRAIGTPGALAFDAADNIYLSNYHINFVKFDAAGNFLEKIGPAGQTVEVNVDPINEWAFFASEQHVYITDLEGNPIANFYTYGSVYGVDENYQSKLLYIGIDGGYLGVDRPVFNLPRATTGTVTEIKANSAQVTGVLNPEGGGPTSCQFAYADSEHFQPGGLFSYNQATDCTPEGPFDGSGDQAVSANLTNLRPGTLYHMHLYAANENGSNGGADVEFTTPVAVQDLVTEEATEVTGTTATLNASFTGNGEDTHYYFDWGVNQKYGRVTAAPPGADAGAPASGTANVSAQLEGLEPGTTYHYRVVATNGQGTTPAGDREFTTQPALPLAEVRVTKVHSDSAEFAARVNPRGQATTFRIEYGPADCASSSCAKTLEVPVGSQSGFVDRPVRIEGLTPATTYHYRLVATNVVGVVPTAGHTFTTFARQELLTDPCPNAQVRKQTGAAQLLECRAYELVSAASAGGYDVESDLAPNQEPFEGFPDATQPSRVLYTVHAGSIPGTGTPTNFSIDPYVATRTADGWATQYVGYPARGLTEGGGPFGSPVGGADASLESFAFAGDGLCSPCFPDGSTGIPIRLPDGSIVQGMDGSLDPGPSAASAGEVRAPLSADGSHLVFGSAAKFEPEGNSNGDVSIYDRDLSGGGTHVVSKTPGGATMTGSGIAELAISRDGSRILVGQRVGSDARGNSLYRLYMNVGDAGQTIDLSPGATSGVLFAGMSADGTRVYLTATDALTSDDHDSSADLYMAQVGASTSSLIRVSTGTGSSGDTDACAPTSGWSSVAGCDAVAIAGGGGVAAEADTVYFLSPEKLDGSAEGVQNAPNLYVSKDGAAPAFVATLSPQDATVVDALAAAAEHVWGDFQVTGDGAFAAFPSSHSLTGFENGGFPEVYRFVPGSGNLDCVSCAPTEVAPTSGATLPSRGLGLSDDGTVFFTSGEALSAGDNDGEITDAYEWQNGTIGLISNGIGVHDSGMFSISRDGADAFFFTRETQVATDHNGQLMKIYDARVGGGFLLTPPPVPCQASDECHGPGTQSAGPPPIGTYQGSGGNVAPKARSRRHRPKKHRHHRQKRHRQTGKRSSR